MIASKKLAIACTFSFAALAFAPPARAGDAAAAEALFNEARKLMSQGNFAAACPQLEESQKLDPGMGTLYNLGDCYEKTGRIASAWAAFLEVAAQAKGAGQTAREGDARARAAALESKLSRLTVVVEGPLASLDGLAIKRGGVPVGKAQWGLALPVDPGEHPIEVSAPGKKPWSGKVQIPPNGAAVRFAIPALEDAPATPTTPPTSTAASSSMEETSKSKGGNAQRTTGLVIGGIGIVSLGAGAIFGAMSMGKKSDGDDHCKPDNNHCDAAGVTARDDAIADGNLSTIFLIIGGAATMGGITLYLTAPKEKHNAALITPMVARGGGGLSLRGSFQ
jgi:hypothetical protein